MTAEHEPKFHIEGLGKFKFSEQAQQALKSAIEIGSDYGHVETEHVLLGLLNNSNNTACRLLAQESLDLQSIKDRINFLIERGKRDLPKGAKIILTRGTKTALQFAQDEAAIEGEKSTDTHHLLFGLLLENNGIAANILNSFEVARNDLPKLRQAARQLEAHQEILPLSKDLQLAIKIGKKTVLNGREGCTTPVLFTSMIASSDLVPNALADCGINLSEVLVRLEDYYHIDKMGAPNYDDGLSREAFNALRTASNIAKLQQVPEINPIHFLLGMIHGKNNVVEGALRDLGLNFTNITTLTALAQKASTSSKIA